MLAAKYLKFGHGYVLSHSCTPYSDDIRTALEDAVLSHEIAYYSLVSPEARRADWFGLINSVFPGVMDSWIDEEEAAAYQASIHPLPTALASHQPPDGLESDSDSDTEGPYWDPAVQELISLSSSIPALM